MLPTYTALKVDQFRFVHAPPSRGDQSQVRMPLSAKSRSNRAPSARVWLAQLVPLGDAPRPRALAWWISAAYALVATLWIAYSDSALQAMVTDPGRLVQLSLYKGVGFVAVTSVLLLLMLRRAFGALQDSYEALAGHRGGHQARGPGRTLPALQPGELARTFVPDIVLLDIQLPTMDGYAVARLLRGIEGLKSTPIVAVSSYAMVGDEDKALAAGCSAYIEKPIDPDTFVAAITRLYAARQSPEDAQ